MTSVYLVQYSRVQYTVRKHVDTTTKWTKERNSTTRKKHWSQSVTLPPSCLYINDNIFLIISIIIYSAFIIYFYILRLSISATGNTCVSCMDNGRVVLGCFLSLRVAQLRARIGCNTRIKEERRNGQGAAGERSPMVQRFNDQRFLSNSAKVDGR